MCFVPRDSVFPDTMILLGWIAAVTRSVKVVDWLKSCGEGEFLDEKVSNEVKRVMPSILFVEFLIRGGVLFYWLRKRNFAVTLCRLCTYMQRGIQNIGCSNFSFMCQCQGFIWWYRFMRSGIRKYIGYIKKQSKSANVISGVSCLF